MPFNYLLTLNYILSSIILCLSVALLKVVHQMTGFLTSQSENAENAVIRGLIIARGPRGATLQDIKRKFEYFVVHLIEDCFQEISWMRWTAIFAEVENMQ